MKRLTFLVFCILLFMAPRALGQESDFEVKTSFEEKSRAITDAIDRATSLQELDSLKLQIDSLESVYVARQRFLDKALYPLTFAESINNLRALQLRTYDRVGRITAQGGRIIELEQQIVILTARLDSLTVERNKLFAELQDTKRSLSALRETMKKLQANMQAKDRLIFALVDSIFLPYDKNLNQLGDVQKNAISQKLLKANILARVYDIAADNVKFLDVTQLQPKDYSGLIDQYQQFQSKWTGLRQKFNAVYETGSITSGERGKGAAVKTPPRPPSIHIDSALFDWSTRLTSSFWSGLSKEFSSRNVAVPPFTDGKSFSASVRMYVDSMKAAGEDASVFVEEIWKNRIDKEWRDALSKESMLGKVEYASLDQAVSELSKPRFDTKLILYAAIVILIVLVVWWLFYRKPRAAVTGGE